MSKAIIPGLRSNGTRVDQPQLVITQRMKEALLRIRLFNPTCYSWMCRLAGTGDLATYWNRVRPLVSVCIKPADRKEFQKLALVIIGDRRKRVKVVRVRLFKEIETTVKGSI